MLTAICWVWLKPVELCSFITGLSFCQSVCSYRIEFWITSWSSLSCQVLNHSVISLIISSSESLHDRPYDVKFWITLWSPWSCQACYFSLLSDAISKLVSLLHLLINGLGVYSLNLWFNVKFYFVHIYVRS